MDSIVPSTAPSRSAHVLHLAPPEPSRLARLALPALAANASDQAPGMRTLILVEDADAAVATAAHAAQELGGGLTPIVALTSAARARRVLAASQPAAAAIPLDVAAALVGRSALPMDGIRQLILAMPDAPAQPSTIAALEAVMMGVPKSATRTLVAARETPQMESLIERHFFKARRTREATFDGTRPDNRPLYVLATSHGARWQALRKVLDEIDPPSAAILTPDASTHADATRELGVLGYPPDGLVQAIRDDVPAGITLAVIVGVPETSALKAVLDANPAHLVVLCGPREIAGLRSIAGSSPISPWVLEGPRARAESRAAVTRQRLREILVSGEYTSELKALSPLLDDYDGSEIAAAALVMVGEVARVTAVPPSAPVAPPASRPPLARPESRGAPNRDRKAPRSYEDRAPAGRPDRPRSGKPGDDRARGDRPRSDRPRDDRPRSDRPRESFSRERPRNDRDTPRRGPGRTK